MAVLTKCFETLGFCEKWVNLKMVCAKSVSYRIKINGDLGEIFSPQRGLRQGDPLSPYLFILAAEVLSLLISKACVECRISGIKVSNQTPNYITHMFLADDSMLFTKANREEAEEQFEVINVYNLYSGQRVNLD